MKNRNDQINQFCQDNNIAFIRYLNAFAADKILLSPVGLLVVIVLLIFSWLNGLKYGLFAGLSYAPVILLFGLFKVLFELGLPVKRSALLWTEAVVVSIFLGFNSVLWQFYSRPSSEIISSNGSMTIILVTFNVLWISKSYLEMIGKNLCYIVLEIFILYAIEPKLLHLFKIEIIYGIAFLLVIGYLKNQILQLYFYHTETGSASLLHAYNQLQKLVFPHQLNMMKVAYSLEETLPVGSGEATVISFDIQNSTRIPPADLNHFIQKIMLACHEVFSAGYSHNPLQLTAFKLKEMGDGFICTVGFPFAQPGSLTAAETAVKVALECQSITARIRRELALESGFCSIGIASGTVYSYYTRVGIKVYDVYGSPLVLANRYEEFRKLPQYAQNFPPGDIITVQASTMDACSAIWREQFHRIDLESLKMKVRDDAAVKHLYLAIFEANALAQPSPGELLGAS